jgi:uncharacterized membrane protein
MALAERRRRHDYDRLLMLSDGVFAIAITLAALEIRAPEGWTGGWSGLLNAMSPALTAYGISFVVIAAYWSGHRRMFATLTRVDGPLIGLNLLFLGLVALQPAAVALLTRIGPREGALELYLGLIGAIGAAQTLFWGYAAFVGGLVDPQVRFAYRVGQLVLGLVMPIMACLLILYSSRSGSPLFLVLAMAAVAVMVIARRLLTRRLGG